MILKVLEFPNNNKCRDKNIEIKKQRNLLKRETYPSPENQVRTLKHQICSQMADYQILPLFI